MVDGYGSSSRLRALNNDKGETQVLSLQFMVMNLGSRLKA
jgi:hypothetical protein